MQNNKNTTDTALLGRVVARTREKALRLADRRGHMPRFMEVCGTHTVALSRTGLRSALADCVKFVSGPGCPVCVTPGEELRRLRRYAEQPKTVVATFGDMVRVPDDHGLSLGDARSEGARVQVVMSAPRAVELAADNPELTVVFAAVGFETTAPGTAVAVADAEERGLDNFFCHVSHKLTPPGVFALLEGSSAPQLDGFLCPGHVSTIIGSEPWRPLASRYGFPAVVGGFEAQDLLLAINMLLDAALVGEPVLRNAYKSVVRSTGNQEAQRLMKRYFEPRPAAWRGLGTVSDSGLGLRSQFEKWDAHSNLVPSTEQVDEQPGDYARLMRACRCAEVLTGRIVPPDCPLFGKACTPSTPVGPCMVSSEGSCAAYYLYEV